MSKALDSIKFAVDFSAQTSFAVVQKIVCKPGNVKKTLEVAEKAIKGLDYYHGHAHYPSFIVGVKHSISFIGFYDLFKNVQFWVNPFNVKNIDQKKLKETLLSSLKDSIEPGQEIKTPQNGLKAQAEDLGSEYVDTLVKKVLNDPSLSSNKDIVEGIKKELMDYLPDPQVQEIVSKMKIQLNVRAYSVFGMAFCSTVFNIDGARSTCDKLNIADSAKLAAMIGTKAPIFLVIFKAIYQTASKGFIILGVSGLVFSLNDIYKAQKTIHSFASEMEKKKAYKSRKEALWNIASGTTSLASSVIPMVLMVSTPTVIVLGLASSGTGLLKILAN
jgi:hypothetical protein